jgi:hypothetical protein
MSESSATSALHPSLPFVVTWAIGYVDPLQTTDRRRPPLDLILGELMHGLRKPTLSNLIGIHRSPFL